MEINGRRVDCKPWETPYPTLQAGDYGLGPDGRWYCVPPGKDPFTWMGCLGDGVSQHKVTVHEDRTITVTPSIFIGNGLESWHGWLERGVWREQ